MHVLEGGGFFYWSQCNRQKLVQTELVSELDPGVLLHQAGVSTVTSRTKEERVDTD